MDILVRFRGLDSSDALRAYAERRVSFRLGRFGHALRSVLVKVSDVNGPRGGLDKLCHVQVRGEGVRTFSLQALSGDAYAAVDVAVGRIARVVGRELARVRDWRGLSRARPAAR